MSSCLIVNMQSVVFSLILFEDDKIQLYKGCMQDFTWKTTIADTKRTLRSHHYIGIEIWRKYLNGIALIESTQEVLEKKVDKFINHKIDFNTAHIIKSDIQQITKIPEKHDSYNP